MDLNFPNPYASEKSSFYDEKFSAHLQNPNEEHMAHIITFFTILALCHSIPTPEHHHYNTLVYNAQSPDEAALVVAAKELGIVFLERHSNVVTLSIFGTQSRWTVLNVLEFSSDRKRMSVIVKKENGEILLYSKGADE